MYSVAGEAAANAAGMPIEKLVRNRILRPLGLTNTGFTMGEMSDSPNHALPYMAASYEDAVAGRFIELPLDGGAEKSAAAGDMYASVLDLARWGQVIMKEGLYNGKQVLSKEGIAATLTAHTIFTPAIRDPDVGLSVQYGMGWGLGSYKGNNLYQHSKASQRDRLSCRPLSRSVGGLMMGVSTLSFYVLNRWSCLWLHHRLGNLPECRAGGSCLDQLRSDCFAYVRETASGGRNPWSSQVP